MPTCISYARLIWVSTDSRKLLPLSIASLKDFFKSYKKETQAIDLSSIIFLIHH